MTPAELHALLDPHGIRPIRGRSQHFLLDDAVVEAMVSAAGVEKNTHVLEIGPGPGILTEALLKRGARVVAAELDLRLCVLLRQRFGDDERFTLREGDALAMSNAEIAALFGASGDYVLVANLPYAITSAVIQKFLLEAPQPREITVMIQKEVADRRLARAEKGAMGSLAVLAQTYATMERVIQVPKSAFYPPPRVESTVIKLTRRSDADLAAFFEGVRAEKYFSIIHAGFASPRKQLRNTLRAVEKDEARLLEALKKAEVDGSTRPERLTIEDWARLARTLHRER
ncbi:MAG: hypothetical protein RLZZ324_204 [Candidatus Parcubacteria bacterium]